MKSLILLTLLLCHFGYAADFHLIKKEDPESSENTLLVISGIHGDEPGAYYSASILSQHYHITKGNLWVVPNLNQNSIVENQRGINGDMNRKFLHITDDDPDRERVERIKTIITDPKVGMVLNLHDGRGFYREKHHSTLFNPNLWGQTCVIDQCDMENNSTYTRLNAIANKVTDVINNNLLHKAHTFNVKNTKTKFHDEAMQYSLTYFAVTHNKAAFAIETSKNLSKLSYKIYYQLLGIESFMKIMKISYEKDFLLSPESIETILKEKGSVTINKTITLPLNHIKKDLSYIPLQFKNNEFDFSNVLGSLKKDGDFYSLYVGHEKIVNLWPQYFSKAECNTTVDVIVDDLLQHVTIGSIIEVKKTFEFLPQNDLRINIIGLISKEGKSEDGIKVALNNLIPKYAIDRSNRAYRAELYKKEGFCGMILVKFIRE